MKRLLLLVLFCAGSAYGQECIDSDGDGWGWDGSQSCRVAATAPDACDYTNAGANGGWGWNPVSGTSCPPVGIQDDEPTPELDGIASAIVGTWVCNEEMFYDGKWNVEKGTEIYEGVTVDEFQQRTTFNADGSYFSEVGLNRSTGQYQTQDNDTWRLNGFIFGIGATNFIRISFESNKFSFYYNDTSRRSCVR